MACLPTGVALPDAEPPGSPARAARAPAVSVFLDVSGSMAGYVQAPRPAPRPPGRPAQAAPPSVPVEPRVFRDLVLSLPQLAASVGEQTSLWAFGKTIRPLPSADLPRAADPRFYADGDSRIQDALARMDALPPEEVGLLVTDLFLSGDEVFAGGAALRAPLARILESGRGIALLGVRAGFNGSIYDIPGQPPYAGARERPFYVLATGPAHVLARLVRRIETELLSPLPPTPDGGARHHAVLFTHEPFRGSPAPLVMRPAGRAADGAGLAPDAPPALARIRFPGASGTATAMVPLQTLADPITLVPDQFQVTEQVWAAPRAAAACAERWRDIRSLPPLSAIVPPAGDDAPTLSLGGPAMARVTPGVTFLLRASVTASGLSAQPARTAWARGWNLEARDAEAFVATRPTLFRTLNLREVVSMLEGLIRDRLVLRPVAEAVVAFQVTK